MKDTSGIGAPARRRLTRCIALFAGALLASAALKAQAGPSWIESAHFAFATAKSTEDGAIGAQHLVVKRHGHPPQRLDPGIPAGIPISALAIDGADVYLVTRVTWRMGQTLVTPRDVVKIGPGGNASLFLRGNNLGLPHTTRIEALSIRDGEVLFSLDIHADIGGLKTRPSDILQRNGNTLSIRYAANTLGIPASIKLSALDRTANGNLLMSFANGGEIAGLQTMPGDLLEYRPESATWTRNRSRTRLGVECAPCDLTAIATITSASTVFRSGVEAHED